MMHLCIYSNSDCMMGKSEFVSMNLECLFQTRKGKTSAMIIEFLIPLAITLI